MLDEQQAPQMTASALVTMCRDALALKQNIDRLEAEQSEISRQLEALKKKILAGFEDAGIEKQHIPGFGLVHTKTEFTVRVPQGDNKRTFFGFLKQEPERFEALATINHATLNSWYKKELQAQLDVGNVDFKVPGIDPPKLMTFIGLRRE